jgi:hypothetical protein
MMRALPLMMVPVATAVLILTAWMTDLGPWPMVVLALLGLTVSVLVPLGARVQKSDRR